ncbi:hypothetical protein PPYR_15131 [Photinus pyralis]|uniref:DDE-1 domain-containing protein n=1 Tax=Photinus pyralis TaxID=7054 RepID=A0A5N4A0L0_PHOPY|nr:hypothetical protein PPYR_15131 [Photinus pyralis]
MVMTYKRKVGARPYQNYDEAVLQRAVNIKLNTSRSYKDIADEFGIPAATIFRKVKNKHSKQPGGQIILTKQDEVAIKNAILVASEFSQNIKASRAEISPEVINKYFDKLEESFDSVSPEAIVNYDETNFCDDPGKSKVVVQRGTKRAEKIMDTSKSSTSVMFSVSASGVTLPPYIVYKADHIWQTWTERGPDGARCNRTKSGWFDQNIFEDWFFTIALPYFKRLPPGPKILIGQSVSADDITSSTSSASNVKKIPRKKRCLEESSAIDETEKENAAVTSAAICKKESQKKRRLNRKENNAEESESDEANQLIPDDSSNHEENEIIDEAELTEELDSEVNVEEKVHLEKMLVGDFLLCDLNTVKGSKIRYITEVMEIEDENLFQCSFLRQNSKNHNVYIYPHNTDIATVTKDEIVKILSVPEKLRRGGVRFKEAFI